MPKGKTRGFVKLAADPAGLDEFERAAEQRKMLFIISRVSTIDLNPLSRTCNPARLKWPDIVPGKLQFCRSGNRQAQTDAVAADAGEHFVADKISIETVYFSCAHAREFEK